MGCSLSWCRGYRRVVGAYVGPLDVGSVLAQFPAEPGVAGAVRVEFAAGVGEPFQLLDELAALVVQGGLVLGAGGQHDRGGGDAGEGGGAGGGVAGVGDHDDAR